MAKTEPSESVIAVSETHLAPTSIAEIDDVVAEAAARAWVETYGNVERTISWTIGSYITGVLLGGVLVHPAAFLLLVPHVWLLPAAVLTDDLSRRAFNRKIAGRLSPKAQAQIWTVVQRGGPALLRTKGRMRLRLGPAPAADVARVPDVKALISRAHDDALAPRRRRRWWWF